MADYDEGGSIAAMINRFRNDKPMSREERLAKRRDVSPKDKFWWLSEDDDFDKKPSRNDESRRNRDKSNR